MCDESDNDDMSVDSCSWSDMSMEAMRGDSRSCSSLSNELGSTSSCLPSASSSMMNVGATPVPVLGFEDLPSFEDTFTPIYSYEDIEIPSVDVHLQLSDEQYERLVDELRSDGVLPKAMNGNVSVEPVVAKPKPNNVLDKNYVPVKENPELKKQSLQTKPTTSK